MSTNSNLIFKWRSHNQQAENLLLMDFIYQNLKIKEHPRIIWHSHRAFKVPGSTINKAFPQLGKNWMEKDMS